MIIRKYVDEDRDKLYEIWKRYYSEEFQFEEFQEFRGKFIELFTVVDDDNKIISSGGIRAIAESIIITDKSFTPKQRKEALLLMLQAQTFMCKRLNFEQLHAFIQDEKWLEILKRYGFQDCKGKAIYINSRG